MSNPLITNRITKNILQELISKSLSTRTIAERLGCSQTNVRYWLRKFGLTTKASANMTLICEVCGASLKGNSTKFCSSKCKASCVAGRKSSYEAQLRRGLARKHRLIELHGGKCLICGYRKNTAALVFHHSDASNKAFNLDLRKLSNTNWRSLLEESKKCQLLCANCHAEVHYPNMSCDLG